MTEILKNNPIALRHCLLYEFLQGKSIEEAFSDFCKAVRNDVIKKKSFEFWFEKFFWGIFDDANEPIADIRDILRNDKYALRACILYESLVYKRLEKNISKSYRFWKNELVYNRSYSVYKDFCKAIGDDVMEFRKFDFWFYRFLNGEIDLNFEMDKDKKIYELMEIPLDVMRNIVEYLDIFDRMSLVKTSRSFKTFVEDQKVFHPKMILHVGYDIAYIDYNIEDRRKVYGIRGNSTEEVPVWKEAIHDFQAVLSYPNLHLNTLKINFQRYSPTLIAEMTDEFVSTHQVHLKNLCFEASSIDPLLKILPLFTPGYLTTIDVSVEKMNGTVMNKVTELEQWKQATRVSVNPDFDLGW